MAEPKEIPDWVHQSIERMRTLQSEHLSPPGHFKQKCDAPWLDRALRGAGVGQSHIHLLLGGKRLDETTALLAAKRFRKKDHHWCLVLAGSRGVGKTLASEWLLLQHLSAQADQSPAKRCIFSTFHVMKARRDDHLMDRIMAARFLILDDLGVEILDHSGAFLWCLFEVINHRWSNRLPTVITSNLSPADFGPRYGHRVIDRLRDGSMCIVVKGLSLR